MPLNVGFFDKITEKFSTTLKILILAWICINQPLHTCEKYEGTQKFTTRAVLEENEVFHAIAYLSEKGKVLSKR